MGMGLCPTRASRGSPAIRRKDGSTVDSFEDTLEPSIIMEPYNLDSSISSTKRGVYQLCLLPNERVYFWLAILNL